MLCFDLNNFICEFYQFIIFYTVKLLYSKIVGLFFSVSTARDIN
jgi:hypothetical protein